MDSEDSYMQDCFLGVADDLKTIWEFSENRGGFFKWGAGFSPVYCGIWNARGYIQWGSSIRGVLYTLPITGQYLAQIS